MPTVPETLSPQQKLPRTPETQSNETPLIFQDHDAELTKIKEVEPEAKLPEADMKAFDHYLNAVMGAEPEYTAIGVPEPTQKEKDEEESQREPLLRMIGRGLVDFFPHLVKKSVEIAEDTVEDARMTIRRRTPRDTESKNPLQFLEKRAAQLNQESPADKKPEGPSLQPVILDPNPPVTAELVAAPAEPVITTNAVSETPSNILQFPKQEAAQPQPVAQKPQQIAA